MSGAQPLLWTPWVAAFFGVGGSADRSTPGYSRPWQAGLEQKPPPCLPRLSGAPWQASHSGPTSSACVRMKLARWWLSGCFSPAFSGSSDATLPLAFSRVTSGKAWHSVHCRRMTSPLSLKCLPSWQRKQPGVSA